MVGIYQGSFNAGEFSPLLDGQNELDKRASASRLILNMFCLKQGPLARRGGTIDIGAVKDQADKTKLIPFQYSNGDSYQIEVGDGYLRFYKNHSLIESGGSPYEIVSPYALADLWDSNGLFRIHKLQSADVLYLFHGDYKPRALARYSDTNWALTTVEMNDGPYMDQNITTTTLTPSGTSGSITITASSTTGINNDTGFQTTDVGRIIKFRDSGSKEKWLLITGRTSTTVVTCTVKSTALTGTTASSIWRLGLFSDTTGWPTTGCFHQSRVCMGGAELSPDTVALSKSGGYSPSIFYMSPMNEDGVVGDDNGFTQTLGSDQVNKISTMFSDLKGLIVCTTAEEWMIDCSTTDGVLKPSNAKSSPIGRTGAAAIQAVRMDTGSLFVQFRRKRIFDIVYSFETDRQKPRDITLLCEHIPRCGIIDIVYLQEPYNAVLALLRDGSIMALTYYPDQKIFAGSRFVLGGVSDADGSPAVVESMCVTSSPDGSRDEVIFTVKRYVNGTVTRRHEYMSRFHEGDMVIEDGHFVDGGVFYDGVYTEQLTGLDHLEGQTVKVMIDGRSSPDQIVVDGTVNFYLPSGFAIGGTKIHIGLSYIWEFEPSVPMIPTSTGITSLQTISRVNSARVRLFQTLGLYYGVRGGSQDEYTFNQLAYFNTATPLFTGDTPKLAIPSGYDTEQRIYFGHNGVFPATVLSLRMEGKAE